MGPTDEAETEVRRPQMTRGSAPGPGPRLGVRLKNFGSFLARRRVNAEFRPRNKGGFWGGVEMRSAGFAGHFFVFSAAAWVMVAAPCRSCYAQGIVWTNG